MAVVVARSEPDQPEPPDRPSTPAETPESAALANSSALSGCTDEATPEGADDTGLDLEAITANVERLRELRFAGEPDIELLPAEELDARLAKEVGEEYRPADAVDEERALKLVGAIPPGADLYELRTGGLEGQVAGLYLPETKELLVAEGEDPGAFERIALAHELEHALTDEQPRDPASRRRRPRGADPLIADPGPGRGQRQPADGVLRRQAHRPGRPARPRGLRRHRPVLGGLWRSSPTSSSASCSGPTPTAPASPARSTSAAAGRPSTAPTPIRPAGPTRSSSPSATARRPRTRPTPAGCLRPGRSAPSQTSAPPSSCGCSRLPAAIPSGPSPTPAARSPPGPGARSCSGATAREAPWASRSPSAPRPRPSARRWRAGTRRPARTTPGSRPGATNA